MSDDFSPAVIEPVASAARPRWSVMIPTYHSGAFLRATLGSVLAQDPGPHAMQIEVVDDHSTADDPGAIVREVAGDRVQFFRQPDNVGHAANFDTCLLRSRGHLVHLLHGDDAVRPGFYATMASAFDAHPEIGAAFCRTIYMDAGGRWTSFSPLLQRAPGLVPDALAIVATRQPAQPPAIVVRRAVYEQLGGFDRRLHTCAEDWEMYARIAAHHPLWHDPEPLALYRRHRHSLTGRGLRTGQNARDARLAIATYRRHVPALSRRVTREAYQLAGLWMLMIARGARETRDDATWLRQLWEAVRTSQSRAVLRRSFREVIAQARAVLHRADSSAPHESWA